MILASPGVGSVRPRGKGREEEGNVGRDAEAGRDAGSVHPEEPLD